MLLQPKYSPILITITWTEGVQKEQSEIGVVVDNSFQLHFQETTTKYEKRSLQGTKVLLPQAALEPVYSSTHTTLIPLSI